MIRENIKIVSSDNQNNRISVPQELEFEKLIDELAILKKKLQDSDTTIRFLLDNVLNNLQQIINMNNLFTRKVFDWEISKLSPKELAVANIVRDGKSNREIGIILKISQSTVLTQRHHVRAKFGLKNTKNNTRTALKLGQL